MAQRIRPWLFALASIASLVVIALMTTGFREDKAEPTGNIDRLETVARGDFPIAVLATGQLEALKQHHLAYKGKQIKGGLVIVEVVEDRTAVKKDDVIIRFSDDEALKEEERLVQALADDAEEFSITVADDRELFDDTIESRRDLMEIDLELFLDNVGEIEKTFFEDHAKLVQDRDDAAEDEKKGLEDLEISLAADLNKVKSSAEALRTAHEAFERYENLESKKARNDLLTKIETAEAAYNAAKLEVQTKTDELTAAQNQPQADRERIERAVQEAKKKVENGYTAWELARDSLRNHKQYGHPEKLRALTAKLDQARLTLKQEILKAKNNRIQARRTLRNNRAAVVNLAKDITDLEVQRERDLKQEKIDYEAEVRGHDERLVEIETKFKTTTKRLTTEYETKKSRNEKALASLRDSIEKLVLRAPIDGIVNIGVVQQSRHGYSQGQASGEVKVGGMFQPNQVLAAIPDLSKFVVTASIPESFRSQINLDLKATFRSPAIPDLQMYGDLTKIAPMSTNVIYWDKTSPKVYATQFNTETTDERLMPGMTVEIEILIETVTDVVHVPIEALFNRNDQILCRIEKNGNLIEREVSTGRRSLHSVEIIQGLEPGERIALHNPEATGP
jgi:HlyD family secretion protein